MMMHENQKKNQKKKNQDGGSDPPRGSRKRLLDEPRGTLDGTLQKNGSDVCKKEKIDSRNVSFNTRSNMVDDGSSVYAELRARNPSAVAASPGSSLRSIDSLSEGQEIHREAICDLDILRQVPIMESEAQSKQGSNTPSDTKEKDALEKSTTGATNHQQGATKHKGTAIPDRMYMHTMDVHKRHTSAMTPSSMRDSGTHMDVHKLHHNTSAGSAALCPQQYQLLLQHQQTRQGLAGLNRYYIQTQQQQMKAMSGIVNSMAQAAGDMIKQGHNPASLNMSAAIRACSLANVIIYKSGCLVKPAAPCTRGPPVARTTTNNGAPPLP